MASKSPAYISYKEGFIKFFHECFVVKLWEQIINDTYCGSSVSLCPHRLLIFLICSDNFKFSQAQIQTSLSTCISLTASRCMAPKPALLSGPLLCFH